MDATNTDAINAASMVRAVHTQEQMALRDPCDTATNLPHTYDIDAGGVFCRRCGSREPGQPSLSMVAWRARMAVLRALYPEPGGAYDDVLGQVVY